MLVNFCQHSCQHSLDHDAWFISVRQYGLYCGIPVALAKAGVPLEDVWPVSNDMTCNLCHAPESSRGQHEMACFSLDLNTHSAQIF